MGRGASGSSQRRNSPLPSDQPNVGYLDSSAEIGSLADEVSDFPGMKRDGVFGFERRNGRLPGGGVQSAGYVDRQHRSLGGRPGGHRLRKVSPKTSAKQGIDHQICLNRASKLPYGHARFDG